MRESETVEAHGVGVHVEFAVHAESHRVAERIRIVDSLLRVQFASQRNGHSFTYELCGFAFAFRSNQVQGAKLVVLPPAPPVRNLLEQFVELLVRVGLALGRLYLQRRGGWSPTR